MKVVKISASIIAGDLTDLRTTVKKLESAQVDSIHVDVMDGHFFDRIGLGDYLVKALKKLSSVPIEVHLAVVKPEKLLEQYLEAGVNTISIQLETCTFPLRVLRKVKAERVKAGVALLPSTPIQQVRPLINYVDQVLLLSNNDSGFFDWDDSIFLPETFERISELLEFIGDGAVEIAVDGGIGPDIAKELVRAGANVLVMGRSIFAGDIIENIARIRSLIKGEIW